MAVLRATTSPWGPQKPFNPANSGVAGSYGLYNTAVGQQAGDYSSIMQGYKNLSSTPGYQNLASLATTGGYSPEDIANIRERGISPIRSIYASAQQNVERNKALQGGYAPNYGAVQAKLAREMSGAIGDQTTKVNADIAQRVAQNKIGLAPTFAAQEEAPLKAQQSLYGTTPALSNLFGNQALQAAQLQNQINQAPAISPGFSSANAGGIQIKKPLIGGSSYAG